MDFQTAQDLTTLTEIEKKHIPVIRFEGDKVTVGIGEVPHPMEDDHYIEWVELYLNNRLVSRKNLIPGRKPEAIFHLKNNEMGNLYALAHCNQHGTWKCQNISLAEL